MSDKVLLHSWDFVGHELILVGRSPTVMCSPGPWALGTFLGRGLSNICVVLAKNEANIQPSWPAKLGQ